ncbi:unnamed protein product [Dovyalis caffra]|uniref:Uncharacterized protein n=1 Tax=Dovyalis caffra TaxID=77055 RepID=A0AAV1RUX3_9ROSI|nr:unnamed protein product [Dovyalis caffra]
MEEDRKTKLDALAEEQENDDEDEKIEKFFAIIKRLRDVRKYSTNSLRVQEARKIANKAKKVQASVWTPKFQPEDFEEPGDEIEHMGYDMLGNSLISRCMKLMMEQC